MLRIDIITVVPELLDSPLSYSIPGRAVKKGLAEIHIHDLRKYGLGSRQTVDGPSATTTKSSTWPPTEKSSPRA